MSAVCVLTPVLIGGWPAISAAISGVATALGFTVASAAVDAAEQDRTNQVEVDVENSAILDEVGTAAQVMHIERAGVRVTFSRDDRGACKVCVSGSLPAHELRKLGRDVAGRLVQQYAYHKLITELKQRNYSIVDEQVQGDDSIRVRIRMNG